jgi:Domain of unknown function (DUF4397)
MRVPRLAAASVAAGVLCLTAGAAVAAIPASAATGDATVTIVHGIPNTPVDVYANNDKILSGFAFKSVAGPLTLPAGSYKIDVRKAGSQATSAPVLSATEQLTSGENATIVAALTAAGTPALTPFVNDTATAPSGDGRLVVRHVAAAPPVDVYAGTAKVISALASGKQAALNVPAGTVTAKVTLAGQSAAVLGPVNVPVTAGMGTVVYAIGSASGKTLTAVTQTYALGGMPSGAQAGSGGLGADPATPAWPFALAGLAGLALAVAGTRGIARRRRA